MAVFPESMDKINPQNVVASFAVIERYIRYMQERIEFSIRNVTRIVSKAGISSTEMYLRLQEVENDLASIESLINSMLGSLNALSSSVTAINNRLGTFEEEDPTIKETLDDYEARISALEHPTPPEPEGG